MALKFTGKLQRCQKCMTQPTGYVCYHSQVSAIKQLNVEEMKFLFVCSSLWVIGDLHSGWTDFDDIYNCKPLIKYTGQIQLNSDPNTLNPDNAKFFHMKAPVSHVTVIPLYLMIHSSTPNNTSSQIFLKFSLVHPSELHTALLVIRNSDKLNMCHSNREECIQNFG
jgi:hypothetical protein